MTAIARLSVLALLASAVLPLVAQQQPVTPATAPATVQDNAPAAVPPSLPSATQPGDTPPRGTDPTLPKSAQEPGAATLPQATSAPKLSEKEQRKRQRNADKAAREKEKDASYLKLQGNEIVAPTLDANGKPVELAPCARKDKECQKKRKALLHRKKVGMKIENGTLTVDGWTGKARLNYDISEIKFLYVSIPGQGTVIASMEQFPNSQPQKNALEGKTLTIKTPGDHLVQISSDENLVDKKDHAIYVAMDPSYTEPGRFPTIGYGSTARAPYNWPGVRPLRDSESKISAKAPPLPTGMAISQMKLPCQKVAPGEKPKAVKINGIMMTPEACTAANAGSAAPPNNSAPSQPTAPVVHSDSVAGAPTTP